MSKIMDYIQDIYDYFIEESVLDACEEYEIDIDSTDWDDIDSI